jgi:hypothetical protein
MENEILSNKGDNWSAWRAKIALIAVCLIAALALRSACILGPTSIKVIVTDENNAAVSSARVLSESQPAEQNVLEGTTSQEGNMLIFNPVMPGEYQFQVSCPGYALQTTQITVQRGMVVSVNFKLKAS